MVVPGTPPPPPPPPDEPPPAPPPPDEPPPPSPIGVAVAPTTNLQTVIDANPTGTNFLLEAGTFRVTTTAIPKNGQSFVGVEGETIISGAQLVTGWTYDAGNDRWFKTGQTQSFSALGLNSCDPWPGSTHYDGCRYFEQYYYDDTWLFRVDSLSDGATGLFYFDNAANTVYIWDDPNGHTVEAAITAQAFQGFAGSQFDATFDNLIIEKFVGPPTSPATRAAIKCGTNWVVRNCEIRYNRGVGITLNDGCQILSNNIHHNGQYGVNGTATGALFDDNDLDDNNQAFHDSNWDSGGSKFTGCTDMVLSNNRVRRNRGAGLWCDANNFRIEYANNTCEDNYAAGIMHEVSFDADIHDNTLARNALLFTGLSLAYSADILIATSGALTTGEIAVYNNTISTYVNAISVKDDERGVSSTYGKFRVKNVNVHDNVISFINDSGLSTPLKAAGYVIGRPQRTVTSKALTSNVATLGTSAAHAFEVGDVIRVSGVDATFNGDFTVIAVPTSTSFRYSKTAANIVAQAATGGATDLPESIGEATFTNNTYNVPTSGGIYWYDGTTGNRTWTQWQAAGQDTSGTRNIVP